MPGEREVSGASTSVLVRFLRRVYGEKTLAEALRRGAPRRTPAEVEDTNAWFSEAEFAALFEAAASVTGDPEIARAAGEEVLREHAGTEVAALLRSLGSPGELLRNIAATATKYSLVSLMEAREVGDNHAVVASWMQPPAVINRHACGFKAGVLSQASVLFGLPPAQVDEVACQRDGAPQCIFRIVWGAEADAERDVAFLEAQLAGLGERFQSLQRIAIDLAAARDTDAALDAIVQGAGAAVRAPCFVLAVRVNQEDRLRVHTIGLDGALVDGIVEEILAESPDDHDGSRLVVDVASTEGNFGRLAALYPENAKFFPQERGLLETYAAHAAAALGMAAALDAARRRDITARTLLELAHSLADLAAPADIAVKIVLAARQVVDCDAASMWVFEQGTGQLVLAATDGWSAQAQGALEGVRIGPETALLAELFATREPRFLPCTFDDAVLAPLFELTSSVAMVAVPILTHDTFLGAVTVGVRTDPSRLQGNTEASERLLGLARHAASALQNASLLEQVRAQALRDELTGLPNRRLLDDRTEQALKHAQRAGRRAAILFLDVDRFKGINDSLGHAAGDDVLRAIADRLTRALRAQDTAARIGGDEFAVLLPQIAGVDDAATVAAQIARELSTPVVVRGQEVFVSASVGTAVYPDDGLSVDQLMRAADDAMYLNKDRMRRRFKVLGNLASAGYTRVALEAHLHDAVSDGRLLLLYQPIVQLSSMTPVSVEALVRWEHPKLGILEPQEWIGIAEETGLIADVDRWVLRAACTQLADWDRAGLPHLTIAVNLSTLDLSRASIVDEVSTVLADAGLAPQRLHVEITENIADVRSQELRTTLKRLRHVGVAISIDDFGTENSNLTRLSRFPCDALKIDRQFIEGMRTDPRQRALVQAVISMGAALDLNVVAEGIETEAERNQLVRYGCTLGQGFYFANPMAAADFAVWMSRDPQTGLNGEAGRGARAG